MTTKREIARTRRSLYRAASVLGDVQAVMGGPSAVVKRVVRKHAYRSFSRLLRWAA